MNRQHFFSVLGVSAGTVLFAPFLVSCSKSSNALPPNNGTGGGGGLDFTLDLTLSANSALNSNGGSVITGGVIVARTSAGSYIAVASACTHQGYTLAFNSDNQFHCQNPAAGHGSIFASNGSVTNGPAVTALKVYNTSLSGTSLRVYA